LEDFKEQDEKYHQDVPKKNRKPGPASAKFKSTDHEITKENLDLKSKKCKYKPGPKSAKNKSSKTSDINERGKLGSTPSSRINSDFGSTNVAINLHTTPKSPQKSSKIMSPQKSSSTKADSKNAGDDETCIGDFLTVNVKNEIKEEFDLEAQIEAALIKEERDFSIDSMYVEANTVCHDDIGVASDELDMVEDKVVAPTDDGYDNASNLIKPCFVNIKRI